MLMNPIATAAAEGGERDCGFLRPVGSGVCNRRKTGVLPIARLRASDKVNAHEAASNFGYRAVL